MGHQPDNSKIPQLKLLALASLKNAAWNPENRIKKENLTDLIDSMSKHKQLTPITVTSSNRIIMGHRRVAAARALGWTTILGFVRDDLEMDVVYAEDLHTARKMSGHDSLGVWLKNKNAVGGKAAMFYETMTNELGIGLVEKIYKNGFAYSLFRRAKQICKYVDKLDDNGFLIKTAHWLINEEMSSMAQQAMARDIKPSLLVQAVNKSARLKIGAQLDI